MKKDNSEYTNLEIRTSNINSSCKAKLIKYENPLETYYSVELFHTGKAKKNVQISWEIYEN